MNLTTAQTANGIFWSFNSSKVSLDSLHINVNISTAKYGNGIGNYTLSSDIVVENLSIVLNGSTNITTGGVLYNN